MFIRLAGHKHSGEDCEEGDRQKGFIFSHNAGFYIYQFPVPAGNLQASGFFLKNSPNP
jgi:hypothetical protein